MPKRSLLPLLLFITSLTFAQNIDSGLVHYYSFNGHSDDSTSNGNDLQNFGPTDTTDRFGNAQSAYHFSQGQYLSGSAADLPQGNAPRTVSFWINLDFDPDHDVITCWGNQAVGGGYGVAIGNDFFGSGKSIRHFGWGNDETFLFDYSVNTWFHMLTTYDGDTAKVYVNGNLVNTSARSWSTNASAFYVGQNINKMATDYFNGSLDDLRFYNRVLSPSEIAILAETTVGIAEDPSAASVMLYPNPAQTVVFIQGIEAEHIRIYDAVGQLVVEGEAPGNGQFGISELANGLYTIQISTAENKQLIRKLLIEK